MKPLNKFELWIIKIITGNRYYLVIANDEDVLENSRHFSLEDMTSVMLSAKKHIERMLGITISLHVEGEVEVKKPARKSAKKVAKKHE